MLALRNRQIYSALEGELRISFVGKSTLVSVLRVAKSVKIG